MGIRETLCQDLYKFFNEGSRGPVEEGMQKPSDVCRPRGRNSGGNPCRGTEAKGKDSVEDEIGKNGHGDGGRGGQRGDMGRVKNGDRSDRLGGGGKPRGDGVIGRRGGRGDPGGTWNHRVLESGSRSEQDNAC